VFCRAAARPSRTPFAQARSTSDLGREVVGRVCDRPASGDTTPRIRRHGGIGARGACRRHRRGGRRPNDWSKRDGPSRRSNARYVACALRADRGPRSRWMINISISRLKEWLGTSRHLFARAERPRVSREQIMIKDNINISSVIEKPPNNDKYTWTYVSGGWLQIHTGHKCKTPGFLIRLIYSINQYQIWRCGVCGTEYQWLNSDNYYEWRRL